MFYAGMLLDSLLFFIKDRKRALKKCYMKAGCLESKETRWEFVYDFFFMYNTY